MRNLRGSFVQNTVGKAIAFEGVGLHSGRPVRLVVVPAPSDHGIWFRRTDIADPAAAFVAASWTNAVPSPLCTRLRNEAGTEIVTVEHLLAALAGCGVRNAVVEIEGPEVPILDGSSRPFVEAIMEAGIEIQAAPDRAIEILKPVEVRRGASVARLEPAETLQMDFAIEFEDAAIGAQSKTLDLANGAFVRELCDSRTFCRRADVDAMRAQGLALGGSLDNAVVVEGADVLSPGGLRHADEAVRHKMLDALGDLSLAGAPIIGRYTGRRSGHALTGALLEALFADPSAWRMVTCDAGRSGTLPGAGVKRQDLRAAL